MRTADRVDLAELRAFLHRFPPAERRVALRQLRHRLSASGFWLADPVGWCSTVAGVDVWSQQGEILEAVRDHQLVAVKSCHAAGKSLAAALMACWWIDCHPPGEAFVVSTAPTEPQVRAILWRYINRIHAKAGLAGRTNQKDWQIGGELVGLGRKPNDYEPDAFQGIHARYVLVLLDEACGIPGELWDAATTLATNDDSRVLAIGNPDDAHGEFYRKFRPGSAWKTLTIRAAGTPNFTGEAVSDDARHELISQGWVGQRAAEWGEDSPLYRSKVDAEFPTDSDDGAIPASWVEACRHVDLSPGMPHEVGLDVGAGGDLMAAVERRGPKVGRVETWREPDPNLVADDVAAWIAQTGAGVVKVDYTGVGWGFVGLLRDRLGGVRVDPVLFGAAATDKERFENVRAELWYGLGRDLSRDQLWDLGGLSESAIAELIEPKIRVTAAGRVKIEPKDEVRKRLGRSPDVADALLLAFCASAGPVATSGRISGDAGFRVPGVITRR